MRRVVARNLWYRLLAVGCFALGAAGYFGFAEKEPLRRILVHALPPEPPSQLWQHQVPPGYLFGGHITTCGWEFVDPDISDKKVINQEREKCAIRKRQARTFLIKNWQEKRLSYMEIEYPCMDCYPVYYVRIEQNKKGEWQIPIVRRPDRDSQALEFVAVRLELRRATEDDRHADIGESLLVFVDAAGKEILAL